MWCVVTWCSARLGAGCRVRVSRVRAEQGVASEWLHLPTPVAMPGCQLNGSLGVSQHTGTLQRRGRRLFQSELHLAGIMHRVVVGGQLFTVTGEAGVYQGESLECSGWVKQNFSEAVVSHPN